MSPFGNFSNQQAPQNQGIGGYFNNLDNGPTPDEEEEPLSGLAGYFSNIDRGRFWQRGGNKAPKRGGPPINTPAQARGGMMELQGGFSYDPTTQTTQEAMYQDRTRRPAIREAMITPEEIADMVQQAQAPQPQQYMGYGDLAGSLPEGLYAPVELGQARPANLPGGGWAKSPVSDEAWQQAKAAGAISENYVRPSGLGEVNPMQEQLAVVNEIERRKKLREQREANTAIDEAGG